MSKEKPKQCVKTYDAHNKQEEGSIDALGKIFGFFPFDFPK